MPLPPASFSTSLTRRQLHQNLTGEKIKEMLNTNVVYPLCFRRNLVNIPSFLLICLGVEVKKTFLPELDSSLFFFKRYWEKMIRTTPEKMLILKNLTKWWTQNDSRVRKLSADRQDEARLGPSLGISCNLGLPSAKLNSAYPMHAHRYLVIERLANPLWDQDLCSSLSS